MLEDTAASTALYGRHIESIRPTQLPDLTTQVYLDSSGQPPVPRSILNAVHDRLCNGPMISNPHSDSPSGISTRDELDEVRSLVCREVFHVARRGGRLEQTRPNGAVDSGWELVFTSGTTASLQSAARNFDFGGEGRFAYLEQTHSSLLGLRDVVSKERGERGAKGCDVLQEQGVVGWVKRQCRAEGSSLLALPLQCNATGKRYSRLIASILIVRQEAERHTSQRKVYLLLDAASYLSPSTNLPLLSDSIDQPDFICFSFLKILGYPSGLGGLLLSRGSTAVLLSGKQYYGGGALEAVTSRKVWRQPARELKEALEDGTQNLFGIIAVKSALKALRSDALLKGWDQASDYVDSLTRHLYKLLCSLHHSNGSRAVQVYSAAPEIWQSSAEKDIFHQPLQSQGPILLFNVLRPAWKESPRECHLVDPSEVDRLACVENIHMRSGRMCNIGAITQALDLDEGDIQLLWERGVGCGAVVSTQRPSESNEEEERLHGLVSGCLRVSLSAWNTLDDLDSLISFLKKYFLDEDVAEADYQSCDEGCSSGSSCDNDSDGIITSSRATSNTSHSLDGMDMDGVQSEHYLKDLHLYPIKSCARQVLTEEWKVTSTGLEYDRQFCIVDVGSGKVLSQKQVPKMARIRPVIKLETQMLDIELVDETGKVEAALSVSLRYIDQKEQQQQRRSYDMCGKALFPTLYASKDISGPLSSFLNRDCTLGRFESGSSYNDQDRTPLLFSNESPFLLISSESVKQVCRWVQDEEKKPAQVDRVELAFRSNFIIASSAHSHTLPFYEEKVRRVGIGPHSFAVMGPCRRCQMIAMDQTDGKPAPEILSVVARHCRCQQGKLRNRILFGIHLYWLQGTAPTKDISIQSGMPVTLHF